MGIGLFYPSSESHKAAGWLLAIFAGLFLFVFGAAWKLRLGSWGRLGVGAAAVAGVLAYLAHDDPAIRRSITLDDFSPPFPGAEQSFNLLMRYGKTQALAKSFKSPSFKEPYPNWGDHQPEAWRRTLTQHRAEIEAHWNELAPERAWWNELSAYDRIGDLTAPSIDADIVSFQVFRALSQHATAMASLQAIDGHGDEAIDTLLPTLEIGRKLQPSSRTLVRSMIGIVIERMSLETAGFILDTTKVSPAALGRLAGALRGGDPAEGARHMIGTDYVLSMNAMRNFRAGQLVDASGSRQGRAWVVAFLQVMSPILYNPRATFNLAGESTAKLQDLVASRDLKNLDLQALALLDDDPRLRIKNLFGRLFLRQTTPAYDKVSANFWRTQDLRQALIDRLRTQFLTSS